MSAARRILLTGLFLFVVSCTTNYTQHTYNKWQKFDEKQGVIFASKRLPIKEHGAYFKTSYVGTYQVQFQVYNKSGEDRCVKLTVQQLKHASFRGEYQEYKLVKAGKKAQVGIVSPDDDKNASWSVLYNVRKPSTDKDKSC